MKSVVLIMVFLVTGLGTAWSQTPAAATTSISETSSTAQFEAELKKLGDEENSASGVTAADGAQLASKLFQIILWTLITCLLAYLILGKLLPKILQLTPAGRRGLTATAPQGLITIIDRLPLDARRSVCVVKVGDEHFLVGVTDQAMTMLSKLDLTELGALEEAKEAAGLPGLSRFTAMLKNHSEKGTST